MYGPTSAALLLIKLKKNKFSLKLNFKPYNKLLLTPLVFVCLILLSFTIIWIFGNNHLNENFGQVDFSSEGFSFRLTKLTQKLIPTSSTSYNISSISPIILFFAFFIQCTIFGGIVNLFATFGEEFGWRNFLLNETKSLGFFRSSIFIGTIWGLWHIPLIIMGHNYPSSLIVGILIMCLFTITISPIFSYLTYKTNSILAPCLFHGMINSIGILFPLYISNGNELYSSVVGISTILSNIIIILFIFIFDKKFILKIHSKIE